MLDPNARDHSPVACRLAHTYRLAPWWHVDDAIRDEFRNQVMRWFPRIPADVRFVHGEEPYKSRQEMTCRLEKEGVFLCRWHGPGSHVLGGAHMMFRAVHDWYSHHMHALDFGLPGELACYEVHAASGMFSKRTLPLVWSEVVLENAYYCYFGKWYQCGADKFHLHPEKPEVGSTCYKPVFDPRWGDRSDF